MRELRITLKWNSARLYKKFSIELPVFTAYHPHAPTKTKVHFFSLFYFFYFLFDFSLSWSLYFFLSSLISCRNGLLNFFLPHTGCQVLRGFWSMKDFMRGGHLLIQEAYTKIMLILILVYLQLWRDEYPFWDLTSMLKKMTSLLWNNVGPPKIVRKRQKLKQSSEKRKIWRFWEK